MGEKKHALLSPSSAAKWINCPPSARLEEQLGEEESEAAREGTLAHDICELKLRKLFIEKGMSDATFKRRLNKLKKHELYQKEMDGHTDAYVDYVSSIAYSFPATPYMAVEKEFSYDAYAREGFGTSDCLLIAGTHMHVFDFKYGHTPVSADHNPQMMLYALGAVCTYGFIYPVQEVTMHIIQPRVTAPARCTIPASELLDWADKVVRPMAALAWEGKGDFKQGDWCDKCYCAANGCCKHRAEENLQLGKEAQMPVGAFSYTELGDILARGRFVAAWIKKVEAQVIRLLQQGKQVPGWKLVEGQSKRQISDFDKAIEALVAAGYQEDLFYINKPLPMGEIEGIIDKKDKPILETYIVKPPGAPVLAEESDKRPAYVSVTPEEAFGEKKEEKDEP